MASRGTSSLSSKLSIAEALWNPNLLGKLRHRASERGNHMKSTSKTCVSKTTYVTALSRPFVCFPATREGGKKKEGSGEGVLFR